ncbi:hypothetical protein Agabi119p4_23 [Agaricus bisporus var. burnettii]|uniref:Uncharacterized protein n=1 Tax=Agaricus bisporus var. burnettii TaxID=192524 RepID=A0A8H7FA75_AGABI|nr:hypothetical protein Agabi119p4_23 [Agaricus bisporus var. burnettii]
MNTDNNNVLDVEDDDQRQARIQALLENLNSDARPQPPPGLQFDFGNKPPFDVNPPAELLSRVQAFLPQIQASNEALTQRMQKDPDSVNIEHVSEHMDQYIQMNLGLGVFEDRSKKSHDAQDTEAQDTEMSSASSSLSSEDADNDSDLDSDASSEIITSFVPERIIRPLPRRPLNKTRSSVAILPERSEGSPSGAPQTQA